MFDFLKKKKKAPARPLPPGAEQIAPLPVELPSEIPVEPVLSMQSQGLTNNQIIQTLQRQGYSSQQIYDALSQAEAKKTVERMVPEPPEEIAPPPMPPSPAVPVPPSRTESTTVFEELAEQIVEEKWKEVQKKISKLDDWKSTISSRMDKIEQSIVDLKSNFDGLHKAILSRITEYDKTLMDVGTEIKAMEKVFEKVLPDLTSNVQELSRITKAAKSKSEKKIEKKPESKKSKLESKL